MATAPSLPTVSGRRTANSEDTMVEKHTTCSGTRGARVGASAATTGGRQKEAAAEKAKISRQEPRPLMRSNLCPSSPGVKRARPTP